MARAPRGTRQRQVRLTDAEWAALATIAGREGLSYGGQPSPAEAIRWLVARDGESAREKIHKRGVDPEGPPTP